jgi:predicted kinase
MRPTIILVSGYAASGKTRVGKELARRLGRGCYLDKDTVTSPFTDRLLIALGQPAGDRDSEVYRREVRPLEYECLLATGMEAADSGATAILSAPFLTQLVDADWMGALRRETQSRGLELRILWVQCGRAGLYQRMIERGSPRDQAKLDDWPAYSASIDEQFPRRILGDHFRFDNSDDARFDAEMDRLVEDLSNRPSSTTVSSSPRTIA